MSNLEHVQTRIGGLEQVTHLLFEHVDEDIGQGGKFMKKEREERIN